MVVGAEVIGDVVGAATIGAGVVVVVGATLGAFELFGDLDLVLDLSDFFDFFN